MRLKKLEDRQSINVDPRLFYWSCVMPKSSGKHTIADRAIDSFYGRKCLFCDDITNVMKAHLVAGNSSISYSLFCKPIYKDDLDVKSPRNFIPLCGTLGEPGTCHHEVDTYRLTLIYNPFDRIYRVISFNPELSNHLFLHNKKVEVPEDCRPYTRLLSWRARKCLLEFGSNIDYDVMEIITSANLSEESQSMDSF